MIRRLAYSLILGLFAICSLVSLITGEGGVHEFEVSPPDGVLDYATFIPGLFVDFVQFIFSCVTWDFVPDLPTDLRVFLATLSVVPIVVVFIIDILPPLSQAVGALIDAVLPG